MKNFTKLFIIAIFATALLIATSMTAFAAGTTPAITSATYKTGITKIMVKFNVPVWGDTGHTTALTVGDFQMGGTCDFSTSPTIAGINISSPGSTWVLLDMAGAAGATEATCTIAATANSIFTVGGALSEKTTFLSSDTSGPIASEGFGEHGEFVTGSQWVYIGFDEPVFGDAAASTALNYNALSLANGNAAGCDVFVDLEVTSAGADFILEKCATLAVDGDTVDTFDFATGASVYDALGNASAMGTPKALVNMSLFSADYSKVHTDDAATYADAAVGDGGALVRFNYPMFNASNPDMTATLEGTDFLYTDTGGGGKLISSVNQTPNMKWAVVYFSANLEAADLTTATVDTIKRFDATSIYDPWGRSIAATVLNMADNTNPVILSIDKDTGGFSGNNVTITYSENVKISTWDSMSEFAASTALVGDVTSPGVINGFGSFATTGDVASQTTKNTVLENGDLSSFSIMLAGQTGGYLNATSSTEPSDTFTPNAVGIYVTDFEPNTGNGIESTSIQSTITSSAAWDLTKPNLSSVTVSDATGTNGKIDQAIVLFSESIKDESITDADATLGTIGVATGTFSTGTANDETTTFSRTNDTGNVDTSYSAVTSDLLYSGSTTLITDRAGNLLNTLTPGTIVSADITELDAAVPIVTTMTYTDNGEDGSVDTLVLGFSENVTWNGSDLSQIVAVANDLSGFAGSPTIVEGSGTATLTLTMSATTDLTGVSGGTEPTYTYTQSVTAANRVKDQALTPNDLANIAVTSITDGAGAVILSRVTKDTDDSAGAAGITDGTMDGILATFTESMDASTAVAGDFVITLNDNTALTSVYGDTTDDTTLFFGCSDCTPNDTSNLLKLQITGNIADLAGVDAVIEGASAVAIDGAAPAYVSSAYKDMNTDGTIDRLDITFSETVTLNEWDDADWTITAGTVALTNETAGVAVGADVRLTLTGTVNVTGGAMAPTVAYTAAGGTSNSVNDGTNNTGNISAQNITDGAAPIIISIATDTSSGADITTITYSEAVEFNTDGSWYTNADGTKASDADFGEMTLAGTIDGIGAWAGGTVGNIANNAVTDNSISLDATDKILTVTFNDQTGGYFTSTSTTAPAADNTFTPEADSTVLRDQGGQLAVATTTVGTSPTITGAWDLTKPTITATTGITYSENTINGSIDRATITFSETMRGASIADNNCTLAGGGGTFSSAADAISKQFNRTTDDATVGTAASDGLFLCTANSPAFTDLAGNLLETTIGGTIDTVDRSGNEVDSASPVVTAAVFDTASNKNILTLTYSEQLAIYTGGDGATGEITSGSSATSTTTLGAMTTAKTIAGIVAWDGTSDFTNNVATANNVALTNSGNATTIVITFNNTSGSFFLAGATAPTTPTMTPIANVLDVQDLATTPNAVATTTVVASTTAWDATPPSQITNVTYGGINSSDTAIINWNAHATLADFGSYMFAYGTSSGVGLASSLWKVTDASALSTISTVTTNISGLTEGSTYYTKGYGVDIAGNVGTASSEISYFLKGAAGDSGGDSGSQSAAPAAEEVAPAAEEAAPAAEEAAPAAEEIVPAAEEIVPPTEQTKKEQDLKELTESPEKLFIEAMLKAGIFKGNADGTFEPNKSISRAEVAAVFYRVLGFYDPAESPDENPYSDVPKDEWYAGYIQKMKDMKLVSDKVSTYGPETFPTKAEFLKFAMNIYKLAVPDEVEEIKALEEDLTNIKFNDVSAEAWYAPDVAAASAKGFITGTECKKGTCLYANGTITRAKAAKMLYKMFANLLGVAE